MPDRNDAVHESAERGAAYRNGVYIPIQNDILPDAPSGPTFPDPGAGPPLKQYDHVPRVPRLRHVIGPSVIALGMGLGAGEFLLWPNLISTGGFSIWWLFWVGVLTQFVVASEIERWTLATGESVFTGMARLGARAFWAWFFMAATLISFFWPGWAAESAVFIAAAAESLGLAEAIPWQPIALAMMLFIYLALAISRIVYNALEKFEILLVLFFFPLLVITLAYAGVAWGDVTALATGAVSIGAVPRELVSGAQFPTLLIAVAYAGTGGTLLLAQSLWVRDKGFGMGCYQGRVAGIRGQNEEVSETGYAFDSGEEEPRHRFLAWMRLAERELFVTFVVLILISVFITSLIVAATIGTDNTALAGDLMGMVMREAAALRENAGPLIALAFLLGGALVLFSTQVGIVDTVTRISGDVFHARYGRRTTFWTLKRTFLLFLTVLVSASCTIILASWIGGAELAVLEPNFLVLIAGPFTIASMYLFTLVVGYMNVTLLPLELVMPAWKRVGMLWAAVLWGWFTAEQVSRVVLGPIIGLTGSVVDTIVMHPVRLVCYGLWLTSLVWFAWVLFAGRRVNRAKNEVGAPRSAAVK